MTDAVSRISELSKFGWVLGLERMHVLLDKLGNPHKDLKVIHVAGTNGKGSVCRYIYRVLQTAGYHCGLFTSPFLEIFNERIEFDGAYISDSDLQKCSDRVLDKVSEMTEEGYESPTEFEVITAVAFLYFYEKNTDYVVLEVGLGGRGDSTNVVEKPLASIITSISLDHTDRLGDTIAEIAGEKAGIIKEGCPVITASDHPDAIEVFREICRKKHAKLYDSQEIPYEIREENLTGTEFTAEIFGDSYEIEISMPGRHQVQNAVCALYALAVLNREGKIRVDKQAILSGMKEARQNGRLELMGRKPDVLIDGAHNPDGANALTETICRFCSGKKILMVVGFLADKEVDEALDYFLNITKDFVATEPDNPRKLAASELAVGIEKKGGSAVVKPSVKEAAEYALSQKEDYDVILFSGSLYLIGAVRGIIK